MDRGDVVVRTLPGPRSQLAVFAASRLASAPDALVVWTRAIVELKRSASVLAIQRFSDPPRIEDLSTLRLDDGDLQAIRNCEPADCDLKLPAEDIRKLRQIAREGGPAWKETVRQEFRVLLLARLNLYRAKGLAGLPPNADRRQAAAPAVVFGGLLTAAPYLAARLPEFAARLDAYPGVPMEISDSFFYWSKEQYGRGKNVISVTHVEILMRDAPELPAVLVAGKQIFATHYLIGSLGLTAVLRSGAHGPYYLAYMNRSQVDLLGGLFGGIARIAVEDRIERDAPRVVRDLRSRLEMRRPATSPVQ